MRPIPVGLVLLAFTSAPVSALADFGLASTGERAPVVIDREPLAALSRELPVDALLRGAASTYPVLAKRGGSRQGGQGGGRKTDQTGAGGYRQPNPNTVGQGGGSGPQNNSGKFVDERPPNTSFTNPTTPPGPRTTAPNAQ